MAGGKYFLTGLPGSGKSTVFIRCVERLKEMGFSVGGIATPEIRNRGRRTGFSVVDLATGRRGLLAGVDVSSSYKVGRYGVNLPEFESVALLALDHAEESCDVIGIDEIGRMELFSEPFKRKVDELVDSTKPLISVLHKANRWTRSKTPDSILKNREAHYCQVTVDRVGAGDLETLSVC